MKKLVALLLVLLYVASFSGMLWAEDCKAGEALKVTPFDIDQPCSAVTGHSTQADGHPLLQFCKLVEVHKQVLIVKQKQTVAPFSKLVVSIHNIPFDLHANRMMASTLTPRFLPDKLFLRCRVLLI